MLFDNVDNGTHWVQVVLEEQVWQLGILLQLLFEQTPWLGVKFGKQSEQILFYWHVIQFAFLQGTHVLLNNVYCGRHCEQMFVSEQAWQKLKLH